jgi:cytochrome c nitrite reductase small subunit
MSSGFILRAYTRVPTMEAVHMALPTKRRLILYLAVLFVLSGALGCFLAFGPPNLFAKTSSADFCGSCHVLNAEYEAWFHSGAHRRILCVDCHLPNDTKARHVVWKGIEGVVDAFAFYGGRVPEEIVLTTRGAIFLKENCLRCHETTMALTKEDRNCWDCHRRLSHKRSGVVDTLPVTPS